MQIDFPIDSGVHSTASRPSDQKGEDHPFTIDFEKYNIKGPRYTSYPTALEFHEDVNYIALKESIASMGSDHPFSLYIHVPFCENICFYCACNKIITRKRSVVDQYIQSINKELGNYARHVKRRPIKQIHFGGGTPNFLKVHEIGRMLVSINSLYSVNNKDLDLSIELDPRHTDDTYLEELKALGFTRISFGIQDFDHKVQTAINRVCSKEHIEYVVDAAKNLGFASIHIDLIYGLPFQSVASFLQTIDKIAELKPERLSMFNYAHLPHRFKSQKRISLEDLPHSREKLNILHYSTDRLQQIGYEHIGMDHFALADSQLSKLKKSKKLHRNFQGYTTHGDCALLGVGVSSISQVGDTYTQNYRDINAYYTALEHGNEAVWRGYQLNRDDQLRRDIIMQLVCHGEITVPDIEKKWVLNFRDYFSHEIGLLSQYEEHGLLTVNDYRILVTQTGWLFVRNIAMIFDTYLRNSGKSDNYSRTI